MTEPNATPPEPEVATPILSGWSDPHFARVPEGLITDPDVTDAAFRLYARLMLHLEWGSSAGEVFPGYESLGRSLGWSPDKLGRTMKTLVGAGWAHRRRRQGTSSLTFLCARKGQRPTWPGDKPVDRQLQLVDGEASSRRNAGTEDRRSAGTEDRKNAGKTRTRGTRASGTPSGSAGASPSAGAWSEQAREVATTCWDRFTAEGRPPTASSWKGVATVAHQLLEVGHDRDAVVEAIMRARVCTFNACTIELTAATPPPPAPAPGPAPVAARAHCDLCDGRRWVDIPDDDDGRVRPCEVCLPEQYERWTEATSAPAPPPMKQDQPRPPRRRDVDD